MRSDEPIQDPEELRRTPDLPETNPEVLDPSGPPRSIPGSDTAWNLTATMLTVGIVGGAAIFFMLPAVTTRAAGATRSTRLQWEQRESEIDRALQAAAERGRTPMMPKQIGEETPDE